MLLLLLLLLLLLENLQVERRRLGGPGSSDRSSDPRPWTASALTLDPVTLNVRYNPLERKGEDHKLGKVCEFFSLFERSALVNLSLNNLDDNSQNIRVSAGI